MPLQLAGDLMVLGTRVLPVAGTDSRVFEPCAKSFSAATDARMTRNISTFHARFRNGAM